jgi:hypothetical protein
VDDNSLSLTRGALVLRGLLGYRRTGCDASHAAQHVHPHPQSMMARLARAAMYGPRSLKIGRGTADHRELRPNTTLPLIPPEVAHLTVPVEDPSPYHTVGACPSPLRVLLAPPNRIAHCLTCPRQAPLQRFAYAGMQGTPLWTRPPRQAVAWGPVLACRWYGTTFASLQAMEARGLGTMHITLAHHALVCGLVV